jgi:hypothetical protein
LDLLSNIVMKVILKVSESKLMVTRLDTNTKEVLYMKVLMFMVFPILLMGLISCSGSTVESDIESMGNGELENSSAEIILEEIILLTETPIFPPVTSIEIEKIYSSDEVSSEIIQVDFTIPGEYSLSIDGKMLQVHVEDDDLIGAWKDDYQIIYYRPDGILDAYAIIEDEYLENLREWKTRDDTDGDDQREIHIIHDIWVNYWIDFKVNPKILYRGNDILSFYEEL